MFVKTPHTAIFSGQTGCGKSHKVLDLIEKHYKGHFAAIFIICPTIYWNKTYHKRDWVKSDARVFLIDPKDRLLDWTRHLSKTYADETVLFILDDCIASKELDKTRGSLIKLATAGRHKDHYLWMLTQRYTKIPITVRDQLKQLFIWYPKNKKDLGLVLEENDVVEDEDVPSIRRKLKNSQHGCLYLRLEFPRSWKIINDYNNEESEKC